MTLAQRLSILGVCTLLAVNCSSVPKETPAGKKVQVIKSPFAETCTQLGKLNYEGTPFVHEEELTTILKEQAAKLKGNAVRFDVFEPGVTGVSDAKGRATAYRCPTKSLKKYISEGEETDLKAKNLGGSKGNKAGGSVKESKESKKGQPDPEVGSE